MKMWTLFSAFSMLFGFNAFAVDPLAGVPASVANLHQVVTANGCDTDLSHGTEVFDLGFGKKLYLVPCMMGAYQGFGRAYLTGSDDQFVEQVAILTWNEVVNGVASEFDITDLAYDPATKLLTSRGKGRGIGDCGTSTVSKVIVDKYTVGVKTVEVRSKPKCDGKLSRWPIVFKQK